MTIEEKAGQMNMPCVYKQRIGWGLDLGLFLFTGK